jgi:broad specificity phosphatase PhoE
MPSQLRTPPSGFYRDPRPYGTAAAIDVSRHLVGLSPVGFGQSRWLEGELALLVSPRLRVLTSTYRRSIDTAHLAFPTLRPDQLEQTALLDEQNYGEATYMTKPELFRTFSDFPELGTWVCCRSVVSEAMSATP